MTADGDPPAFDEVVAVHRHSATTVARVQFQAQLFLLHGDDPAIRHRVVDLLAGYADANPEITRFQRHMSNRLSPIPGKDVATALHAEADRVDPTIDLYGPHVTDEEKLPRWHGAALMNAGNARDMDLSLLHLGMPAELPALNPDDVVDRVIDWCRQAEPLHGMAGYALVGELGMHRSYAAEIWPLLSRFSGLDHLGSYTMAARGVKKIQGVNWLTVLGAPMVDEIGGTERLRGLLDDAAEAFGVTGQNERPSLLPYDGGVVIRAGRLPQLGDRESDGVPVAYRVVYRALRPWVFVDYLNKPTRLLKVPADVDAFGATLSWVTRFDA